MTQPQLNKTNRKINLNTVITGMLIPIGVGIFWKCIQIYNLLLLQPGIDRAQDLKITDSQIAIVQLTNLTTQNQNTNNQQEKYFIKLDAILPKKYKFIP